MIVLGTNRNKIITRQMYFCCSSSYLIVKSVHLNSFKRKPSHHEYAKSRGSHKSRSKFELPKPVFCLKRYVKSRNESQFEVVYKFPSKPYKKKPRMNRQHPPETNDKIPFAGRVFLSGSTTHSPKQEPGLVGGPNMHSREVHSAICCCWLEFSAKVAAQLHTGLVAIISPPGASVTKQG